jgi:cation diffusion facilitator family transporter
MDTLLPGESREKKRAALLSVGSALLLVSLKSFLVIRTGSLGVLSEALHSGLDLVAAIITFLSIRVSDQPADERHPYGHGKFENFSAFVETGLLLLTALYVIYEAFDRMFFHSVHDSAERAGDIGLAGSAFRSTSRAQDGFPMRQQNTSSEALEADALHFPPMCGAPVVITGIALVWAGENGTCRG